MGEDTGEGAGFFQSLSLTWERAARATRVPGEGAHEQRECRVRARFFLSFRLSVQFSRALTRARSFTPFRMTRSPRLAHSERSERLKKKPEAPHPTLSQDKGEGLRRRNEGKAQSARKVVIDRISSEKTREAVADRISIERRARSHPTARAGLFKTRGAVADFLVGSTFLATLLLPTLSSKLRPASRIVLTLRFRPSRTKRKGVLVVEDARGARLLHPVGRLVGFSAQPLLNSSDIPFHQLGPIIRR
jgi:hypothetical protein